MQSVRKCLFLELWGLGDAVLAAHAMRAALEAGAEVHALVKPGSRALLEPAFLEVRWIEFNAPWTAFRGKYQLWRWDWLALFRLIGQLRRACFTDGFSARPDPRDHLLLWLAGIKNRRSFRHHWSRPLLNAGLDWPPAPHHRAEDWSALARAAELTPTDTPKLPPQAYASHLPEQLNGLPRPWVVLHTGAAQPTRRWPEAHWRAVMEQLQREQTFSLILLPDPTGHGQALAPQADAVLENLSLPALAATLAAADAVLAHDSGPAHIAAALDTPVFAVMGPNYPERFAPRHPRASFLHDPQCPHFPCKDYCHFDEPRCLTHLTAARGHADIAPWLAENLRLAADDHLAHENR
ncbi:MAG: glycosyltransferase family 9 protein [Puniceicoccales bacterium]